MSPTASLRRLVGRWVDWSREHLARFLSYSLDAVSNGHVTEAVLVKVREGKRLKRYWVPNGRNVEHAGEFIVITDCWGSTSMYKADTVHSVEHRDYPKRVDAETYQGKVKY